MDLKTRLESHPVSTLKKEISKTNIKGYSKMKKADVVSLMVNNKDRFNHIKHKGAAEPKKTISIPNEKIEKRKFKVVRKTKGGKVLEAKKEEIHPEGIHLHINWKDGETQLKKYKTKKAGEADFKKIRAERKEKRDYKTLKLMDGKKPLEYSA